MLIIFHNYIFRENVLYKEHSVWRARHSDWYENSIIMAVY